MHLRIPGVYDVEGAALIGDPIVEIGQHTVTVQVMLPTGTVPVTRTMYDTRFGPVVVVPGAFHWTTSTAYAITDVNTTNNRALDGWLQIGAGRLSAPARGRTRPVPVPAVGERDRRRRDW